MAYKRHAQGGRFKAANFGDLGLRAFQEQQDRQIRHLKEQNQQDQAYSKQNLQTLRGNAASEIEHNRSLQNFYNKRDNLAIENTSIRGKREVDALMGEAKEYEKQAKFWQNFSTTYAQQYTKAAADVYDIATTAQSNRQMDVIDKNEEYKKFSQGASKLNNLASYQQVEAQLNAHRDPNISEDEKDDVIGHLSELGLRMNHKTKLALLQREVDNWDQEETNLRALADSAGVEWNAKTAGEFYYLRSRELMRAYEVNPSSKAGRAFLNNIKKKEFEQTTKLNKIAVANAQMQTGAELNEQAEGLIFPVQFAAGKADKALGKKGIVTATGDSFIEYNTTLSARINHDAGTYRLNDEGQVVGPTNNLHHSFEQIMESDIESGRFVSKEQAKNHTILQPIPGFKKQLHDDGNTVTYSSKETWLGRYGEDIEDKFDDAWAAYEKKVSDKFKASIKNRDAAAQIDIDTKAKAGELNLQDPSVLKQLKKTYADLPETIDQLTKYEVYSAYNKTGNIVQSNLTDLYKAGDLKNLTEYLRYLDDDTKAQWESKVEQLEVLNRMGYTGANLTAKAKEILRGILGSEATKPGSLGTAHYGRTVEAIKSDILKTFSEVYDSSGETDLEKIDAVTDKIDKKIAANGGSGSGIYRRTNKGLSTEFLFDVDEKDLNPAVTTEELEKKLSGGPLGLDNLFTGMKDGSVQVKEKNSDLEKSRMLISTDEADRAVRHLNAGIPIKSNKTVEYIFHRQPLVEGKKQYSRRDIWNKYFESIGMDTVIPQGSIEKADYGIEQSPLKITRNYSEANKEAIGVLAELINDGAIDITNHKTPEAIKVEKKRGLFSHPFFTTPHPLAN